MGGYRSDDSEEGRGSSRKHKKKSKKRRVQSRSGSESDSSRVSSSRGKKAKRRQARSSRSHSPDRNKGRSSRRSRSRSTSHERYHSKRRRDRRLRSRSESRSPTSHRGRYSRSPYDSRSRSPFTRKSSRRSRSLSQSRSHRQRSRSHSRGRRSHSGGRSQSRRSSPGSRSDASGDLKRMSIKDSALSSTLTPAQQAEERMRLALKAAAAADQKLRQLPVTDSASQQPSSPTPGIGNPRFSSREESLKFADSVSAIDSGSFRQTAFKSSRSGKSQDLSTFDPGVGGPSHEEAIFGSLAVTGFSIQPDPDSRPLDLDPDNILHPSLFCDPEDKLDRWIERLTQLRKRKLEGDAL